MLSPRARVVRFADSSPEAQSVDWEDSEAAAVLTNLNSGSAKMPPRKSAIKRSAESTDEGFLRRSSRHQLLPNPSATVVVQLSEPNPPSKQVNANPFLIAFIVYIFSFCT